MISNGNYVTSCEDDGALKRCGGQGDLLAGSIATFFAWGAKKYAQISI